uniref:Uncharacterized protein n=1 Tax=Heterorhabditis bacteriophora TaxID=37862 RepID=A0A1I7WLG4_HETBA
MIKLSQNNHKYHLKLIIQLTYFESTQLLIL